MRRVRGSLLPGDLMDQGVLEVVDEGLTTLSWSGPTAVIPLTRAVDLTKHLSILVPSGQHCGYAWRWELQDSQIVLTEQGGNPGYDNPCFWQIARVPAGRVQRGITSVPPGVTTDISLPYAIDRAKALLNGCHNGTFFGYPGAWANGYLKKHASDAQKIQSVVIGGSVNMYTSWEIWSPR